MFCAACEAALRWRPARAAPCGVRVEENRPMKILESLPATVVSGIVLTVILAFVLNALG